MDGFSIAIWLAVIFVVVAVVLAILLHRRYPNKSLAQVAGEALPNPIAQALHIHVNVPGAGVTTSTVDAAGTVATAGAASSTDVGASATPTPIATERPLTAADAVAAAKRMAGDAERFVEDPPLPIALSTADETPIAWAARAHPELSQSELFEFNDFAHNARASLTYTDIFTAYKAANTAKGVTMSDPRLLNPASPFYKLPPAKGETLVRLLVAYFSGQADLKLKADLGVEQWALYTNAYAMDNPYGIKVNFLRKGAGFVAQNTLKVGAADPMAAANVAAVQTFIDIGALPPGSSV